MTPDYRSTRVTLAPGPTRRFKTAGWPDFKLLVIPNAGGSRSPPARAMDPARTTTFLLTHVLGGRHTGRITPTGTAGRLHRLGNPQSASPPLFEGPDRWHQNALQTGAG